MPFVAGALYFNPPIAFVSLIPAYVVGKYTALLLPGSMQLLSQNSGGHMKISRCNAITGNNPYC